MQRRILISMVFTAILVLPIVMASSAPAQAVPAKVKGAKILTFHFYPYTPADGVEEEHEMDVCAKTHTWGFGSCANGTYETFKVPREGNNKAYKETIFSYYGTGETFLSGRVTKGGWNDGHDVRDGADKGVWEAFKAK
jgi:hypothetical protein